MRYQTKMDAKRLITEVYKRPAVWNHRHISYHNRDVTNRVWTEIAALFKLPKQVLKTKWKGLRDTFRAEMKKEKNNRKTKCPRNRPVWVHFKPLQFLKDQMSPRPAVWERACRTVVTDINNDTACRDTNGGRSKPALARTILRRRLNNNSGSRNVDSAVDSAKNNRRGERIAARLCHENREANENDVMTSMTIVDGETADIVDDANTSKDDTYKQQRNRISGKPVKLEPLDHHDLSDIGEEHFGDYENDETMISPLAVMADDETPLEMCDLTGVDDPLGGAINNRCDDNYYFFVSLLPHIRRLPAERRMLLRMQMQQLVYQEVYSKKLSCTHVNQRIVPTTVSAAESLSPALRDKYS